MKFTWKRFLALALSVMMILSLVACTQAPEPSSTPDTPSTTTNPSSSNDTDSSDLKGEIDALLWLSSYPQVVDQIMESFSAKYPDITVNLAMMSGNSGTEALEPRVAAGNMPDVTSVDASEWYFTNVDKGYFEDISDTEAWQKMKPALQSQYTSPNGVKYGVAYGMASMFIYYNKDLFAKAGITEVPTNYDEFLAACEKLKAAGITPIAWPGGFPNMFGHGFISAGIANLVYKNNKDLVSKTLYSNYDYSDPAWVEIYQRNVDLVDKGYVNKGYMSTDNAECIRLFTNDEVAMCWNGSWSAGDFLTRDNVDLFIPPWNAAGDEVIGNVAAETGFGVGKSANVNTELAKVFFNFIAYENYANFQNVTGTIPTYADADCPGLKVDERVLGGANALNGLQDNSMLAFQMFPSAVYTAMMQFSQDVLTGTKKPADISAVLNPIQKEYYDSRAK